MCEFCQSNSKHKVQEVSVNAHLHTPYSFSAFDTLTDALNRAVAENVKVVGINDFYTTAGYGEWDRECRKRKLYPLFNIEFISLHKADQEAGVRVNDPNNPGRTYLSGKGLACPPVLPEPYASQLARVCAETHEQVKQMCAKLNELLAEQQTGIVLDFEWIEKNLTNGSIRERHLAKALRMKAYETFGEENQETLTAFFTKLFGGKPLKSKLSNVAGVENEIRGNLLKSGGAAFVAETPAAFLPMEDVRKIILAAGGIPTYPFLPMTPTAISRSSRQMCGRPLPNSKNAASSRSNSSPRATASRCWNAMPVTCTTAASLSRSVANTTPRRWSRSSSSRAAAYR